MAFPYLYVAHFNYELEKKSIIIQIMIWRIFCFFYILGLQASHLVLSVRTVWVRCPNGEIARRYGITDKNPAGDYWKKIPGQVSKLSGN